VIPFLPTAAFVGYLLGALPFGYLVARARGVNIFEVGSKNPGATNVLRTLGKGAGYTVFALDAVKGALAVAWPIYVYVPCDSPLGAVNSDLLYTQMTGLVAALLGHSFSCFTRFKGGKGVATAAGALLVLLPLPTVIGLSVWALAFYAFRYVSLASILAAFALPLSAYFWGSPKPLVLVVALIAAVVILRHRANIVRLFNGTENKFVKKQP
jgi:glycerol-3-phosphate acyltransferase PlsY